jgi:hypothetical protein
MTDKEALKLALEAAYLAGFNASGEGYNGEYGIDCPEENAIWKKGRDNELTAIKQALVAQQEPVAWLYPEGLEALKAGKCWTAYGTKQDDNCNISVYLAAVAPKVEPVKTECDGFDSHPAAPVQEPVGDDWTPCMKLPVVVHVRQQRPGESHVSTREGITPVKPDDLIMRGVSGEEYPIGRKIFEQTYTLDTTPPAAQPAVPDAIIEAGESPEFRDGWNECRETMLQMLKARSA